MTRSTSHYHACTCPCGCQLYIDCCCAFSAYFNGACIACVAGDHPGKGREAEVTLYDLEESWVIK